MPKTILLADDSVTIQKVVGISFANEDVVLVTVDNGDDAVTQARESRPDIVLADIVMPGLSGYEVCEALRADPDLAGIPVLLLSGTFETFDEARADQVGANGHITKPFEAQALVDRVNELLESGAQPAATSAPDASPEESLGSSGQAQSYDFFDEDMPSLSPAPPAAEAPESPMAETALIGAAPGESASEQVFDLDPLDESLSGVPSVAAVSAEPDPGHSFADPSEGQSFQAGTEDSFAAPSHEARPMEARDDEGPQDVFGDSFAPEEPVAQSSAFSFEESPELAEAVEAFSQPTDYNAGLHDFDPLTSPVAAEALRAMNESPEGEARDAAERAVRETFESAEVHDPLEAPAPAVPSNPQMPAGPSAGDDLYEGDLGNSGSAYLYEGDAGTSFADPEAAAPASTEPGEDAVVATAPDTPQGWDEDPELLSQSALEPLGDFPDSLSTETPPPAADAEVAAEAPFAHEPAAEPFAAAEAAPEAIPAAPTEMADPEESFSTAFAGPASPEDVAPMADPSEPFADEPAAQHVAPEEPTHSNSSAPAPAGALPADLQERMHETLERVAWEAMGDLSDRVIKETLSRIEAIAWEVIPQMAETLIREELARIKDEESE